MAPGQYTDEELARGVLIDKLQIAMTNRTVIRERVHAGHYTSISAAAEALGEARHEVDRAEKDLFDFDIIHPCTRR